MNIPFKVLCGVFCAAFLTPASFADVATTAGSNLTAYNGTGATNNNKWNSMTNARGGMSANVAEANFGNCEAVILRCATPKCSSGCNDASVARPIVAGCVNSNATCKKHGDALIDSLTGQLVARSNAKAQEQQNAVAIAQAQAQAQAAAASVAAEQSNAQMQQMQSQMAAMQQQMAESMANMQAQMAAQNESQTAQIQSALEESRANAALVSSELGPMVEGLEDMGVAEQIAAKNGINPDILVREQIGGQIETAVEDAVLEMKKMKDILDKVFEYAGCDASANNCTGPKRVKKFKDLANEFFDPYEGVVENMYDALILAMTVGIDVSDVIMLLSGSCNMWGKYMCNTCKYRPNQSDEDIKQNGECTCYDKDNRNCYYRVIHKDGKVAKNQPNCRLVGIINDGEEVQREWIDANSGMTGATQVACASDVVMTVSLFRGMKKNATLDIETLRNLINQDSLPACRTKRGQTPDIFDDCGANFCAVSMDYSPNRLKKLENAVRTKKLGKRKDYCFPDEKKMGSDKEDVETEVIASSRVSDYCADKSEKTCEWSSDCEWKNGKCAHRNECAVYTSATTCKGDCVWLSDVPPTGLCVKKGTEGSLAEAVDCEWLTDSECEKYALCKWTDTGCMKKADYDAWLQRTTVGVGVKAAMVSMGINR